VARIWTAGNGALDEAVPPVDGDVATGDVSVAAVGDLAGHRDE
jgi:hypothetical protein